MKRAEVSKGNGPRTTSALSVFCKKGEHKNDEITVIRYSCRADRTGGPSARQVQDIMMDDVWSMAAKKFLGIVLVAAAAALCTIVDALISQGNDVCDGPV